MSEIKNGSVSRLNLYISIIFKIILMFAHSNKLFLVIIALSALTYLERADYNLPLFAFAMLLWDYR